MSTAPAFNWKNPDHLRAWNADRAKFWTEFRRRSGLPANTPELAEQQMLGDFVPRVHGVPLFQPGKRQNRIALFDGHERRELEHEPQVVSGARKPFTVSHLIARPRPGGSLHDGETLIGSSGESLLLSSEARAAKDGKKRKSARMFSAELEKKANRELACGLLGGVVKCIDGHKFGVWYECGNRYCIRCGPDRANESFAKILPRLRLATARLLDCGNVNCKDCYPFRRGRTRREDGDQIPIPHWPPPKTGPRARRVIAILDFMLPKAGVPDRFTARRMNAAIKKTIRTVTRRAGITRAEYGYLYTDEYGAQNTNLHAHGIYCGPRLDFREIRRAWRKAIGSLDVIFKIKMCDQLEPAVFHAIKYPAKFGEHAAADWLAELEIAFHRVRRLHRLGAFYNMPKPEDEQEHDGRMKKCPVTGCGKPLSEPSFNRLMSDLQDEGLRDLRALVREIGKAKVLLGVGLSP
jgi:hypothetical protein